MHRKDVLMCTAQHSLSTLLTNHVSTEKPPERMNHTARCCPCWYCPLAVTNRITEDEGNQDQLLTKPLAHSPQSFCSELPGVMCFKLGVSIPVCKSAAGVSASITCTLSAVLQRGRDKPVEYSGYFIHNSVLLCQQNDVGHCRQRNHCSWQFEIQLDPEIGCANRKPLPWGSQQ